VRNVETDKPKFLVGLGNPGREYQGTRHNIGFEVLAALRRKWFLDDGRSAFHGRLYDARPQRRQACSRRVLLLAPRTYMNRSGLAAGEMMAFYKAPRGDMLVILDDMALPLGLLRFRADGSAGGHKGLADVLAALGGEDVPRLRIGIGQPPEVMDSVDFVLSRFRREEEETVEKAIATAVDAVEDWVFEGIGFVMDKYNRKAGS